MKNEKTKKNTTVVKRKTNPNKVNQYTKPDPRQTIFLSLFLDPQSKTFSNVLQSGLKAGYKREYAENLTSEMPKWLSENLGDLQMLAKAERNLNEILDLEELVPAMGAFGPILMDGKKIGTKKVKVKDDEDNLVKLKSGKQKYKTVPKYERVPVMVINPKLLNIKKDATFFIAERIGKLKFSKAHNDRREGPQVVVPVQVNVNDDREKYAA